MSQNGTVEMQRKKIWTANETRSKTRTGELVAFQDAVTIK